MEEGRQGVRRVLVMLLALSLFCGGEELDLSYPPPQGIHDPARFLDAEFRGTIAQRIKFERDQRKLEIFLLLLENPPAEEVKDLARKAGLSWSEGNYWLVVYQVGFEGEPGVVAGGNLIDALPEEMIEERIRPALGKALLVRTRQSRLEELVNNIATEFGFLREAAVRRIEQMGEEMRREEARKRAGRKRLFWSLGLGLPVLAVVAVMLFLKVRKVVASKRPVEFPKTSPRLRLSGPYSGGGNVQVSFGTEK